MQSLSTFVYACNHSSASDNQSTCRSASFVLDNLESCQSVSTAMPAVWDPILSQTSPHSLYSPSTSGSNTRLLFGIRIGYDVLEKHADAMDLRKFRVRAAAVLAVGLRSQGRRDSLSLCHVSFRGRHSRALDRISKLYNGCVGLMLDALVVLNERRGLQKPSPAPKPTSDSIAPGAWQRRRTPHATQPQIHQSSHISYH